MAKKNHIILFRFREWVECLRDVLLGALHRGLPGALVGVAGAGVGVRVGRGVQYPDGLQPRVSRA